MAGLRPAATVGRGAANAGKRANFGANFGTNFETSDGFIKHSLA
jgi:hypothetical protein